MRCRNRLGVSLALKEDLEGNQRVDLQGAVTIEAPITALSRHHDLSEAAFPEQSLRKSLETCRRQAHQNIESLGAVVVGRRAAGFGDLFRQRLASCGLDASLFVENLDPARKYFA